jgi:predicted Zn-dependent protease
MVRVAKWIRCLVLTGLIVISAPDYSSSQSAQTRATSQTQFAGGETQSLPIAEAELQTGIGLTRSGNFAGAIPHFLAARGHVSDSYANEFNLALCYIGTSQFASAIRTLEALRSSGHSDANVENLLSQAYIGTSENDLAFSALQRAANLTPKNEKLYIFVADACADHQSYKLGVSIVNLGLQNLPDSARLHYQRAYFLSLLDQYDAAKADFDLASRLESHSAIAFLAEAQKNFFGGNLAETIQIARTAIHEGHANDPLLTLLGDALLRAGASPGQPEFAEAESVLRQSLADKPNQAAGQIALGYLLLLKGQLEESREHLEKGRALDPRNPSVYFRLALVYRKLGKQKESDGMLATLAQLNAQEAARINSAPGERDPVPAGVPSRPQN